MSQHWALGSHHQEHNVLSPRVHFHLTHWEDLFRETIFKIIFSPSQENISLNLSVCLKNKSLPPRKARGVFHMEWMGGPVFSRDKSGHI